MSHEGLQLIYEEALTRPVPLPVVMGSAGGAFGGVMACTPWFTVL